MHFRLLVEASRPLHPQPVLLGHGWMTGQVLIARGWQQLCSWWYSVDCAFVALHRQVGAGFWFVPVTQCAITKAEEDALHVQLFGDIGLCLGMCRMCWASKAMVAHKQCASLRLLSMCLCWGMPKPAQVMCTAPTVSLIRRSLGLLNCA